MRISRLFNTEVNVPLALKTLANDKDSAQEFSDEIAGHLAIAKAYFNNPAAPDPDPDKKEYRAFALPLLDALAYVTDPSFVIDEKGNNHQADNFDWILKIYVDAAISGNPIKTEDLQKIHDEIKEFSRIGEELAKEGHKTDLHDYMTYEEFTNVMRPHMAKNDRFRTVDTAPDHILAETTILYHGNEGSVLVPHTHNASRYFGSTNWCISYKNTDKHFNEYSAQSPLVMYLPNKAKGRGEDFDVVSGKVAVTNNTIYNEHDRQKGELPDYVMPLHTAALQKVGKEKRDYLMLFGNKEKPATDVQLHDAFLQQNFVTPVESLPSKQQDILPREQQIILLNYPIKEDVLPDIYKGEHRALLSNKNFMLAALGRHWEIMKHADDSLKKDKDFVRTAVIKYGFCLQYAADELRRDKDFLSEILMQGNGAFGLKYADSTLRKDKDFVLPVLARNGLGLQCVDDTLKKDKEVVRTAVMASGYALEYADDTLKKDKEIVLAAIKHDMKVLKHADESFKKDMNFMLDAIEQNPEALRFADESLDLKALILARTVQNANILRCINPALFKDSQFVEDILDIAKTADEKNKRVIIGQMHRVPQLFGHVSADIPAMQKRLRAFTAANDHDMGPEASEHIAALG